MLADLLRERYEADFDETWGNERTATPTRASAVHLHATGYSLRGTTTILAEVGVERSHGAVWNGVHRLADSAPDPPSHTRVKVSCANNNAERSDDGTAVGVAVDETAVKINGEWSWLFDAIELDTKLILRVELFGRHGTDPAAAFLHTLTEQHDRSDAELLVNQFDYRTSLARLGLSSGGNYTDRNLTEK